MFVVVDIKRLILVTLTNTEEKAEAGWGRSRSEHRNQGLVASRGGRFGKRPNAAPISLPELFTWHWH